MPIFPAAFLIACQLAGGLAVVSPPYPPEAVRGGNVLAVLQFSNGVVEDVAVLSGDEPFVAPTKAALAQWRLPSGERGAVLVIVNFRDPNLMSPGPGQKITVGPRSYAIKAAPARSDVPVPKEVFDPSYPWATLIVQGASILHFKVTESGSADRIEIIQALDDCTQAALDAVKKLKFQPALSTRGKPIRSDAFAVFVYRPLNISNR